MEASGRDVALAPRAAAVQARAGSGVTTERGLLIGLLAAFLLCAVAYTVAVPIWEAPDEPEHFQYVRYLVQQHALPSDLPSIQIDGNQEAKQPPLYYLLAAPLAAGVDLADAGRIRRNPHVTWEGDPAVAAHTLDEAWPWHGVVLAAHRIRLLSALLGGVTVLLTYLIAATCLRDRRAALVATGFVALLPGFLFASATIDNDILVDALSAALLLTVLRAGPHRARRSGLVFGLLAGFALFAKLNSIVPVVVGLCFLARRVEPEQRRPTLLLATLPLAPAAAFYAWRAAAGQRNMLGRQAPWPPPLPGTLGPPDWSMPIQFVRDLWASFVGTFGWQNVWLPAWLYALFGVAIGGGLLLCLLLRRRGAAKGVLHDGGVLCWWSGAVLGSIVCAYTLEFQHHIGYDHSRFLFPALPAIATLVAAGWRRAAALLPRLGTLALPTGIAGLLVAAVTPWLVIRPAYPPPYPITTTIPASAAPVQRGQFVDSVTLAAVAMPRGPLAAGQGVYVTFYWRVQRPLPDGTWLFVHVENAAGNSAAAFDGAPLYGALPLSSWRPGDVIVDKEVLTVHKDAASGAYAMTVGWYNPKTGARVPAAAGGNAVLAGDVQVAAAAASGHNGIRMLGGGAAHG